MLLEETNATGVAAGRLRLSQWPSRGRAQRLTVYYLHDDTLGTPQSATDATRTCMGRLCTNRLDKLLSAHGHAKSLRLPGAVFRCRKRLEPHGFRDYLPALGRYAEPDPLGRGGSGNTLYAYASIVLSMLYPYGLSGWLNDLRVGIVWNGKHRDILGISLDIVHTPDGGSTTHTEPGETIP